MLFVCLVLSTESRLLIQGVFATGLDVIAERVRVNLDRPDTDFEGHFVPRERLEANHKHKEESGTDALALALSVVPLISLQPWFEETRVPRVIRGNRQLVNPQRAPRRGLPAAEAGLTRRILRLRHARFCPF